MTATLKWGQGVCSPSRVVRVAATMMLLLTAPGCRQQRVDPSTPVTNESENWTGPGLGEIMALQQMRHLKLWFAGNAGNWELALYEVDELGEGFDDVVKYHPTHKDAPVAPKDVIPHIIIEPLAQVRAAIEKRDPAAFRQTYDSLTTACNDCHAAMNFGFNVVQRPNGNPYTNQDFEAPSE